MATKSTNDKTENLEILKELLIKSINDNDVKIYLFGSWARQSNKNSSDIDIGIWHPGSPGPEFFTLLRNILEESTFPYNVDIVDLVHATPALVENVQKEGILWTDSVNVYGQPTAPYHA
ncbi:MAG: nucleotidyltransferase domain-containing protein [Peptococcaceae bacterium]|nr:nucleotidyltransferase domain-containing protein [Peptococcaceae bacterium]